MQHESNQRMHRDNHWGQSAPQGAGTSQCPESGHSVLPNTTGEARRRQNKKAVKLSFH